MHYLTVLAILAFVGLSSAWYKNKANNDNYGWQPNRRSLHVSFNARFYLFILFIYFFNFYFFSVYLFIFSFCTFETYI